MFDRGPRDEEEHWSEGDRPRGPRDLAPQVEEYIRTAGSMAGRPPSFWDELIAEWFESERRQDERRRWRAGWFDWRRGNRTKPHPICYIGARYRRRGQDWDE